MLKIFKACKDFLSNLGFVMLAAFDKFVTNSGPKLLKEFKGFLYYWGAIMGYALCDLIRYKDPVNLINNIKTLFIIGIVLYIAYIVIRIYTVFRRRKEKGENK